MTLASIDPLPGIDWSAKAALGHAMNNVKDTTPTIVLWQDEEGNTRSSAANCDNKTAYWMLMREASNTMG